MNSLIDTLKKDLQRENILEMVTDNQRKKKRAGMTGSSFKKGLLNG